MIVLRAAIILAFAVMPHMAAAAERIALLIGNSTYDRAELSLANPVNDVRSLGEALRRNGFEVIEATDLDVTGMRAALDSFQAAATGAEMALFYYAGHGMQSGGDNLLVGVDFNGADLADAERASLTMTEVREALIAAAPAAGLILLDACRNTPFAETGIVDPGLVRTSGGVGLLVAYATDPGNVAYDGTGNNSVFAQALLDNIDTPGLDVRLMLGRVRQEVVLDTYGRQVPWVEEALIGEHVISVAETDDTPPDAVTEEVRLWRTAYASSDPTALSSYLDAYPEGMFADIARDRLSLPGSTSVDTRGIDVAAADPVSLAAALAMLGFPPADEGADALTAAVGLYLSENPDGDPEDLRLIYDDASRNAMVLAAATAQQMRTDLVALRSVEGVQRVSLDALDQIEVIAETNTDALPVLEQARRDISDIAEARERILERLDQSRSYYQDLIDSTVLFLPADATVDMIAATSDNAAIGIDQRVRDDAELFLKHVRESDPSRKGSYAWLTDFLQPD